MRARIAVFAISFGLSLLLSWKTLTNPEDALAMTGAGRFGYFIGAFFVCLLVVGTFYLIGKGILRLVGKVKH